MGYASPVYGWHLPLERFATLQLSAPARRPCTKT